VYQGFGGRKTVRNRRFTKPAVAFCQGFLGWFHFVSNPPCLDSRWSKVFFLRHALRHVTFLTKVRSSRQLYNSCPAGKEILSWKMKESSHFLIVGWLKRLGLALAIDAAAVSPPSNCGCYLIPATIIMI
jgi:hypothetical protein